MKSVCFKINEDAPALRPFILMRDCVIPSIRGRAGELDGMYAPVMGRPETDPVLLLGITALQIMMNLPDRACAEACMYDARWRVALGDDIPAFHPTTLVRFRTRIAVHGKAKIALEACLGAMRDAGYLKSCKAVRIDSTHLLGRIAGMSRLECVRETLRLALEFLAEFGGAGAWEPWHGRYAERNPEELRNASSKKLASCMDQTGADMRDVIDRVSALGESVCAAGPVALLLRVFREQYEETPGGLSQKRAADAGAVINPHDPDVQWSTKKLIDKKGWHGYKAQVCETVEEGKCVKGEPTQAVITAVHVQPAITSDHGSVPAVLAEHQSAALRRLRCSWMRAMSAPRPCSGRRPRVTCLQGRCRLLPTAGSASARTRSSSTSPGARRSAPQATRTRNARGSTTSSMRSMEFIITSPGPGRPAPPAR